MFIKIKNTYINFDNVANFWFQYKTEDWHTKDGKQTKLRFFLNIEYLTPEHKEFIEFETEEHMIDTKEFLEYILKTQKIEFKDE